MSWANERSIFAHLNLPVCCMGLRTKPFARIEVDERRRCALPDASMIDARRRCKPTDLFSVCNAKQFAVKISLRMQVDETLSSSTPECGVEDQVRLGNVSDLLFVVSRK